MPVFKLGECPLPPPDLVIENAEFVYQTNFEGRATTFKEAGNRMFNVRIPDNVIDAVIADNWNVHWTKPGKNATPQQIEEHVAVPFLEVSVGFKYRPPFVMLKDGEVETIIDENTVGNLDLLQFEKVDLVLRGRAWEGPAGCGIKAWLKTFVGVLESDEIRRKYANAGN